MEWLGKSREPVFMWLQKWRGRSQGRKVDKTDSSQSLHEIVTWETVYPVLSLHHGNSSEVLHFRSEALYTNTEMRESIYEPLFSYQYCFLLKRG